MSLFPRLFLSLLLAVPALAGAAGPDAHWVEVARVETRPQAADAERTGTLRARREVRIHTQEEGRIVALPFYPGDVVKQGDVLLRLDDALLRAEHDKALAGRRQAEQDVARLQTLVARHLVPDDQLTRAQTALQVAKAEEALLATRLGYTTIHAPFAGVITERLAEPGDIAQRYAHLLTLADPATLFTAVTVSELLLPELVVGDRAVVRIDALPGQSFTGHIVRLYPTVDERTRQATVEVALDPVPAGARAGQLCRVTLRLPEAAGALIPYGALRHDAQGDYVFVVDEQSTARRRAVRSEERRGDWVRVLEGLVDGERVITKGFLELSEGMAVQVVDGMPAAH